MHAWGNESAPADNNLSCTIAENHEYAVVRTGTTSDTVHANNDVVIHCVVVHVIIVYFHYSNLTLNEQLWNAARNGHTEEVDRLLGERMIRVVHGGLLFTGLASIPINKY